MVCSKWITAIHMLAVSETLAWGWQLGCEMLAWGWQLGCE